MIRSVPPPVALTAAVIGLWSLAVGGCSPTAQRACPRPARGPQSGPFVDPEIRDLSRAQRQTDLGNLASLLRDSYAHLAEKRARFGVTIDGVIAAHAPAVWRATNRYQYMNAVERMLLSFHDGHLTTRGYRRHFTNRYQAPLLATPTKPRARPRPRPVVVDVGLSLRYLAGQVVVTRVRPGSGGDRAGVRVGDVILLVGERPAISRLGSSLRWRGWARLAAGLQYAASRVLIARPWYPDTPMPSERLLIQRGTRRLLLTVKGGRTPDKPRRYLTLSRRRCGVAVLRVGSLGHPVKLMWRRLQALLKKAATAKALILDLRGNRGGRQGMAHRLMARLIAKPVVAGEYRYLRSPVLTKLIPILRSLKANPAQPRWTVWQQDLISPATPGLRVPLAGVIDEVCASACETVARALAAIPEARLYGRATAGSSGLPVVVTLPQSGLRISLPSWQSKSAAGRPIEGHGVPPHMHVPLDLGTLRAGRDAPLEAAIDALCKKVDRTHPGR